ncbi:hypothetical protein MAMC_01791 [Methylacidimicrobium cyclopophantes]|uniref:Uncharacterized protein n=1 Tax=Methylacidimicrobium cyclopophantes TaxID=1041766 RepID=A0A5E6MDQ4_9BACT|nr:hypothetical protein [Methylacidimicrobium cyclopophantes]VVM07689.1 hypothetical protein MAMC_01791 [Methylacidimicrobium cyclopophantes]
MSSRELPEEPKGKEPEGPQGKEKSGNRNFYWVIALALAFFLYLFYSVLNNDTVNIHGH